MAKEADIETRLTMLELADEQHTENIKDLDERLIRQARKWREVRPIIHEKVNVRLERWIIIAITVINLLLFLLK